MKRIPLLLSLLLLFPLLSWAQDPVDCTDRLVVCGNTNLNFNSSGSGMDDFSVPGNPAPDCGVEENQSLWLTIPISEDGTLGFVITPNNVGDDYDFALFGPDVTCNTLGPAVRCSFASPSASGATGMRAGSGDTSESPTGDGFVDDINVLRGETYVLLIDNFSNTNQGFEIEWTGDASIAAEPEVNTPVITPICDLDNDDSEPFDLTTLDVIVADSDPTVNVTYHLTEGDAILGNNEIDKSHTVSNGDVVYARGTFVDNGCAAITDFNFELIPVPQNVVVTGPISVCPDVSNIVYTVTGDDMYDYTWSISGGIISSSPVGTQITVDWQDTNPNAYLEVIATTVDGCMSDPIRLDVTINTRLEPLTPQGPPQVCLAEVTEATYTTPASAGSQYVWTVVNGTLVTPNGTNEVTVRWNADAPGEISYREFNPAIADCEGTSPVLIVTFFPQLFAAPVTADVSCFGEATGMIDLNPTGGTGTLNVTWDDGATGAVRTNLPIGNYTYTITDDNMCTITETITISQPDQLLITELNSGDLLCFEDNTGFAEAVITGGVTPYTYQWSQDGVVLPLNGSEIRNRSMGNYRLQVTDANDCVVSQTFTLDEPDLLEPDLNQLINEPICPQASDGEVTVGATGGTPDYTFVWQLNPVQTGPTATGLARGNYTVTIRDLNGCQTSQEVEVIEQFPRVFLPNAFSPNGDGENDEFGAKSSCNLDSYRLIVFNQWGTPAFSTTNINGAWPGTVDGKQAPDGNYAYVVSYSFTVNGTLFQETIRGEIKVLR